MTTAPFLRVLRAPWVARLLTFVILARLPIGINALAVVLFIREQTGSFATAGLVAGAVAIGTAGAAPIFGRLVDRHGRRAVLVPGALGHALGLGAVVAAGYAGAPTPALVAAGMLAGVSMPPVFAVQRSLWPVLLRDDPEALRAAYALDTVLIELVFIVGPLLVGVLTAVASPSIALGVSAFAVVSGTLAYTAAPPVRAFTPTAPASKPGRLGALESPGMQTLVLTCLPVGMAFGAAEVALPAFAIAHSAKELAGLLIAVWSLASAAGGFVYGASPRQQTLPAIHLRLAILLPFGFAPLLLAPSIPVMALLLIPAGACVAPLIATRNELVASVAPAGAVTEANTWPVTALVAGVAAGTAIGGALAQADGWRAAAGAAVGAAVLGAVVAYTRRMTLRAAVTRQ